MLTINLFQKFNFWHVEIKEGDIMDKRMTLEDPDFFTLDDSYAMMWPQRDDHRFKHGVWPCPEARTGVRVSIVYRWSNPALGLKRHVAEYPHREHM